MFSIGVILFGMGAWFAHAVMTGRPAQVVAMHALTSLALLTAGAYAAHVTAQRARP